MAIKDLAIAYNASTNSRMALRFAIQMSQKYEASLTGLNAREPVQFEGKISHWISDDVRQSLLNADEESAQAMADSFKADLAEHGFAGPSDWIAMQGRPNDLLARAARYYDLLVIGQYSEPKDEKRRVRAEELVMQSGKPLVIVPNGYEVAPFKEYAVVAWDGSRPAARALTDAMQILETKKRLDVVTISASGEPAETDKSPERDVIRHLQKHGIEAQQVMLKASREGVGSTILDYCADKAPDVLVMGAYGHSRLREDLFGGVTRNILQNATVPILMAH